MGNSYSEDSHEEGSMVAQETISLDYKRTRTIAIYTYFLGYSFCICFYALLIKYLLGLLG
jgi:hypothetical protein